MTGDVRACGACGAPREPLLDYEMDAGRRGDTDLCRACFFADADEETPDAR